MFWVLRWSTFDQKSVANRVCSGQAATPAAKHLWGYRENKHCMCSAATCDLNHIMASCTHFGEIQSKDDIAEMEGRAVCVCRCHGVALCAASEERRSKRNWKSGDELLKTVG